MLCPQRLRTGLTTSQRPTTLTGIRLSVDRHLVGVQHLLDESAQLTETHVDSRLSHARERCVVRGLQERRELGVEGDREGGIDDVTIHFRSEVQLHYIAVMETTRVARIRCVVSCHVVHGNAGGESHSSLGESEEEGIPKDRSL